MPPPFTRPDRPPDLPVPARAEPADPLTAERLEQLRRVARLMDAAVRIPGLNLRVGLDALLGLVPGIGDLAGAVVSGWTVVAAARMGASPAVLGRMLLNAAVDAAVGSVPVLGDLFDIGFKANRRNVRLLEAHLADADRTRRRSRGVLLGTAAAVTFLLLGLIVALWWIIVELLGVVA